MACEAAVTQSIFGDPRTSLCGPSERRTRSRLERLIYHAVFNNPIAYRVADDSRIGVIWNGEYCYFSTGHGEGLDSNYPPPAYPSRGDIKTTDLRGDALRHVTYPWGEGGKPQNVNKP
jgi:hypothetical protein